MTSSQTAASSPASAARPIATKTAGSCGASRLPEASRVIGIDSAKIITPTAPNSQPRVCGDRRAAWPPEGEGSG